MLRPLPPACPSGRTERFSGGRRVKVSRIDKMKGRVGKCRRQPLPEDVKIRNKCRGRDSLLSSSSFSASVIRNASAGYPPFCKCPPLRKAFRERNISGLQCVVRLACPVHLSPCLVFSFKSSCLFLTLPMARDGRLRQAASAQVIFVESGFPARGTGRDGYSFIHLNKIICIVS